MKVTHNINSDGWYTSLDTQYRILSDKKQKNYSLLNREKIYLSPKVIPNLGLENLNNLGTGITSIAGGVIQDIAKESKFDYQSLIPYMQYLKIHSTSKNYEYIDLVLEFKTTDDTLSKNLQNPIYQLKYKVRKPSDVIGSGNPTTNGIATQNWEANNKRFIDTGVVGNSRNILIDYRPAAIQIQNEKVYYIVIQGKSSFITNQNGVKQERIKYFDKPLVTGDSSSVKSGIDAFIDNFDNRGFRDSISLPG